MRAPSRSLGSKLPSLAEGISDLTSAHSPSVQPAPRAVTPDTAPRLARYFKTTPEFRLNLQTAYDLSVARQRIGAVVEAEVQPMAA